MQIIKGLAMSPKPIDEKPFAWEEKLKAIKTEAELAELQSDATTEIQEYYSEHISKPRERVLSINSAKEMLNAAINLKRSEIAASQAPVIASEDKPPESNIPPVPQQVAPQNAPKGPPKAPPMGGLNKKPKELSPQEAAKKQAEKAKEEKRKQNLAQLNKLKQEEKERALKANDKELAELRKKAAEALKEVEAEIRALDNKIILEGLAPLGRLARDSEPKDDGSPNDNDPIQAILLEINLKKGEVNRIQNALDAVQKNSRLNKIGSLVDRYKTALKKATDEATFLEKGKDEKINLIKKEVAEYRQKMESLNHKKEQRKVVVGAYDDVKREKPEKIVNSKDPNATVNHAAMKMAGDIAKVENFTFEEQIILRNFFYENSANPENENPLMWDNRTFEINLRNALHFGRILPYTNPRDPAKPGLKELLARSVFDDDNNPTRVKKIGEAAVGKISPDITLAIGGNKPAIDPNDATDTVIDNAASDTIMPAYKPSTSPQKDLSGEDTALKILKNVINSIVIKDRYDRAGDKKSFISLYLKAQNKDRPVQIQFLQNAVQNAANEIALLRGELKYLDEATRKERLNNIFNKVSTALDSVENEMQARGHKKKGTSRMENVIGNLRNEISTMKAAVGLEASKPKKASPN